MLRVGLISDTHGLLRPEATAFLRGSDYIVHGGDIGAPSILEQLTSIAPVTAVRGNNDTGPWAESLPEAEFLQVGANPDEIRPVGGGVERDGMGADLTKGAHQLEAEDLIHQLRCGDDSRRGDSGLHHEPFRRHLRG